MSIIEIIKIFSSFKANWSGTTQRCVKFFLLAIFLSPISSFASTIYYQSTYSTTIPTQFSPGYGYYTNYSTSTPSVDMSSVSTSTLNVRIYVQGDLTGQTFYINNGQYGATCYYHVFTAPEIASVSSTTPTYLDITSGWVRSNPGSCTGSTPLAFAIQIGSGNFTLFGDSEYIPWILITSTPPYPLASSIHIDTPTSQTYLNNPINFSGTYDNIDTYNNIQFDLTYGTSTATSSVFFPFKSIPNVNGGGFEWSTSRNLPYTGPYTVKARLYDSGTGSTTNWSNEVSFALGSTSTNPYVNAPLADCDTLDIACYISNALVMVFQPDASAVAAFYSVDDALATRAPFIYGFQTPALFSTLLTSSSTASTTLSFDISMPGFTNDNEWHVVFMSTSMLDGVTVLPWLRLIIGYFMILGMVDVVYRQFITIHNKDTK